MRRCWFFHLASHPSRARPRGFELAPLIGRRALVRRMFPALQRFTFPAPLSPTFPTSPHPAPVPSARLPHVPVDISHDVHVDALLNSVRPTQPAAEPERNERAPSCSYNPTPLAAPPRVVRQQRRDSRLAQVAGVIEIRLAGP